MKSNYKEYKQLNLTETANEIRKFWEENGTFQKSLDSRDKDNSFVFFEGPPSANGLPGIHHVMARTIKDIVCRYQTLNGKYVVRKAGWDTHGLPVELGVEKKLGITKEDIGKKISVDDYNRACREEVLKYKDRWDELTRMMGYWVNLDDPYITFKNEYIETLWFLLKKLYDKGLLYKGYTIQPYSPAAGTGLSSHELNMPGCYRDVKDLTCVAIFYHLPLDVVVLAVTICYALLRLIVIPCTKRIFFPHFYGFLHFIAYLCTLEVLPLSALWFYCMYWGSNLVAK